MNHWEIPTREFQGTGLCVQSNFQRDPMRIDHEYTRSFAICRNSLPICLRSVCDLCAICLRSVCDLCSICLRSLFDLLFILSLFSFDLFLFFHFSLFTCFTILLLFPFHSLTIPFSFSHYSLFIFFLGTSKFLCNLPLTLAKFGDQVNLFVQENWEIRVLRRASALRLCFWLVLVHTFLWCARCRQYCNSTKPGRTH